MKKFILGLFVIALFTISMQTSNAQVDCIGETDRIATDVVMSICFDAFGHQVDCETGLVIGESKKKRKKR